GRKRRSLPLSGRSSNRRSLIGEPMFGERLAVRVLNALLPRPMPASMPGLVLGCNADQPASDVTLPLARRFEHVMVLGKSGAGKTHFLEHVALQHFVRDEGFVLLDF